MPVVGRITAKFDADTKDLDASLKGIEGAVTGTTLQVTAGFSKMEGSLAKTTSAIHAPDLADRLKGLCQLLDWLGSQLDAARKI